MLVPGLPILGFAALLQQPFLGATSPPSGDTTGYWQQHVHYTIVATLDEAQTKLRARATLVYTNNSPDTLREMFVHQYLNAFRPGSKWSAADAREHRVRFQYLQEPDYGYERFTSAPAVNGTPVVVDYPGAPDSTVAHFRLPAALPPHDSLRVTFEWDARPSVVLRRQGRRGRTYDFAQWYPKVAVYDRGGWEPNPLVPAGELYGEYGTYDVTMIVRSDQVVASTGVPVSGDPGWSRVSRGAPPRLASTAYGALPPAAAAQVPEGFRAVRFFAENVHHFAWSASPDYLYEGALYVRQVPHAHFPTWDTVSVHVLYKPGDDTTWGGNRAVERTLFALKWLESIWGPYAYPQFSNVHRLEGGGTEFPMMIMDGSASQGLILHEAGHNWTYGILGNNEWRSGWLDEGLTDYQTDWALKLTPQERIGQLPEPPLLPEGYRVNPVTIPPADSAKLSEWDLEVHDRTQPVGIPAYEFREFGIYNSMIYDRAKLMYGQLRDALGDSAFRAFFHDYYDRWALKHVDERAMRASVARTTGHDYGWFFDEWVHGTGLLDYALTGARVNTDGARYESIIDVTRRGELKHPMPVGVWTASGWTIGRAEPLPDRQQVRVITTERPLRLELDPYHTTWDWDWRNNIQSGFLITVREPRITYNWPYLDQADRSHTIVALAPAAWYSNPQGPIIGIRAKTNYLSTVDIHDGGIAFASRFPRAAPPVSNAPSPLSRVQLWARAENLFVPGIERPLMGYGAGFNYLDGILKLDLFKRWDLSPFIFTPGPAISARVYATVALPSSQLLLPEQWTKQNIGEAGGEASYRTTPRGEGEYELARATVAYGFASAGGGDPSAGYLRATGSIAAVRDLAGTSSQLHVRLFGGMAHNAPRQRAIFASSQDPLETFNNDLFRPAGALFKQDGFNYLPLGGAALRGFGFNVPLDGVVAANGEVVQRLVTADGAWGQGSLSLSAFGDAGLASSKRVVLSDALLSDAGPGLVARGRLYDRNLYLRLDAPVFVNQTALARRSAAAGNGSFAARWTFTVGEIF